MADRRATRGRVRPLVLLCALAVLTPAGQADEPKDDATAPTVEAVLRRATEFYRKAQTIAFTVDRSQKIGPVANHTTLAIALERPNRLAVRGKEGVPGITLVCDGKTLSTAVGALKKYTQATAPRSLAELLADPIVAGMLFQGSVIGNLLADDPYKTLMDGVTSTKYAGLDTLDGAEVHHLKFTQDEFNWELWIAAEGEPTIRKAATDLTKALANLPGAEQLKNQKFEVVEECKDWRIGGRLGADTFTFEPPKGMEKVESLFEGADDEGPSPLLGEPAPDVDLKLLEEGRFRLKDHRGEHLVMLDFWATWCGPCVRELPLLAEVARDYKDKGVVFCAVNQREEPKVIRKFLKDEKLELTVALDAAGDTGEAYHAEAIPLLVLVDKKGVVQSVHVGYSPEIKTTLRKELDALLAGKDLAKEALEARNKPGALNADGLEQVWSVRGPYSGVAADEKGKMLFALARGGRCDLIDAAGKTQRSIRIDAAAGAASVVRFARWGGGTRGAVVFGHWGHSVHAVRDDGTTLWEETGGQGIDDVWVADLDGDGTEEVIVGYNGTTGLHVFSAAGKRLWKREDLGNVWHVCAGDLDGDGKVEVVCTSAHGRLHISAPGDGHAVRSIDPGLYATMVRIVPARGSQPALLLAAGGGPQHRSLAAVSGDGERRWSVELPQDARDCSALAVSPDGTLAAVGLRGGTVAVVEIKSGRIVATVTGQGNNPDVAWVSAGAEGPPLLVVAGGRDLAALRVSAGGKR